MVEKCVICGEPIDLLQLLSRIGDHVVHYNCQRNFQEWLIEKYLEVHLAHPGADTGESILTTTPGYLYVAKSKTKKKRRKHA